MSVVPMYSDKRVFVIDMALRLLLLVNNQFTIMLQQRRRVIQQQLRKHHLQHTFRQARTQLQQSSLPPTDPAQSLQQALRNIQIAIHLRDKQRFVEALGHYRQAAKDNPIGRVLLSSVSFSQELLQVRMDLLPIECTWAQLFVLLAEGETNLSARQELLMVMELNAYHLRLMQGHRKEVTALLTLYANQVPFAWSQDPECWLPLCKLMGETLICSYQASMEIFLEQAKKATACLEVMAKGSEFLEAEESREVYLEVCLKVVVMLHEGNNQSVNTEVIYRSLKALLMQNISEERGSFARNCQHLRLFWMVGASNEQASLPEGDFVLEQFLPLLQGYLPFALQQPEPEYFKMMNTFQCLRGDKLSRDVFVTFATFIFGTQKSDSSVNPSLEVKRWMIVMVKRHFDSSGGQWSEAELGVLCSLLQANISAFDGLLEDIHSTEESAFWLWLQLTAAAARHLQSALNRSSAPSFGQEGLALGPATVIIHSPL